MMTQRYDLDKLILDFSIHHLVFGSKMIVRIIGCGLGLMMLRKSIRLSRLCGAGSL